MTADGIDAAKVARGGFATANHELVRGNGGGIGHVPELMDGQWSTAMPPSPDGPAE